MKLLYRGVSLALAAASLSACATITRGTTIGYRKLDRVTPVEASRVRVRIESVLERPRQVQIALHAGSVSAP